MRILRWLLRDLSHCLPVGAETEYDLVGAGICYRSSHSDSRYTPSVKLLRRPDHCRSRCRRSIGAGAPLLGRDVAQEDSRAYRKWISISVHMGHLRQLLVRLCFLNVPPRCHSRYLRKSACTGQITL